MKATANCGALCHDSAMRAKDLKPIYQAKGYKNMDELAAAVGVGREHLTNALNKTRGRLRSDKLEKLAALLDLSPWDIDPDYRRVLEVDPEEWDLIQSSRRLKNPEKRFTMLETFTDMFRRALESRDNAS